MFEEIEKVYKQNKNYKEFDWWCLILLVISLTTAIVTFCLVKHILWAILVEIIAIVLCVILYCSYIIYVVQFKLKENLKSLSEIIMYYFNRDYEEREKNICNVLKKYGIKTKDDILMLINYYEKKVFANKRSLISNLITAFFGIMAIIGDITDDSNVLINSGIILIGGVVIFYIFKFFIELFKNLISVTEENLYKDIYQSLHVILFKFDEIF